MGMQAGVTPTCMTSAKLDKSQGGAADVTGAYATL
jgi:hypothetical protein